MSLPLKAAGAEPRLSHVLEVGLKYARAAKAEAGGVATVQARSAGLRAGAAVAPIGYVREFNPHDDNERTIVQGRLASGATWVPMDHSCLFHALHGCYRAASAWLPAGSREIKDAAMMRLMICEYMQEHPDKFVQHEQIIRHTVARRRKGPLPSYEAAFKPYVDIMRHPDEWGGYPEIDAASMMLKVIVHQFNVLQVGGPINSALLVASFFPDPVQFDDKDATRGVPKFVLILKDNHFWYLPPQRPGVLQGAKKQPTSTAAAASGDNSKSGSTVAERRAFMKSRRASTRKTPDDLANRLTRDLTIERNARENRNSQSGGGCILNPVAQLSDEAMKQIEADAELARQLYETERQIAADSELAHQMSQPGRVNERAVQTQSTTLADLVRQLF